MVSGQRDVHRVLQQGHGPQGACGPLAHAGKLEQQRSVEFARAQPRLDLLGLAFGQRQLHVGMLLPERGDGQWNQRRACGGKRRHPQPASTDPEHRCKIRFSRVDLGKDRLGVLDQRRTRRGGPHALPVAHHQGRAGFRLEPRNRL